MALPPLYRDFVATDKHYVKNYGLTCLGILIIVIVFYLIIVFPAMISWITSNNPWAFLSVFLFVITPLVVVGYVIKLLANRNREEIPIDEIG